jgi:hypothetical protein
MSRTKEQSYSSKHQDFGPPDPLSREASAGQGPKISEAEFREICRKAASMFVDDTGYTAAVIFGVCQHFEPGYKLTIKGDARERVNSWRRDLWMLFESTGINAEVIFSSELTEARQRRELDIGAPVLRPNPPEPKTKPPRANGAGDRNR